MDQLLVRLRLGLLGTSLALGLRSAGLGLTGLALNDDRPLLLLLLGAGTGGANSGEEREGNKRPAALVNYSG